LLNGADATRGQDMSPEPQHRGAVSYMYGDVGSDEEDALKAQARNYNLQILKTDRGGHYITDVNLVISGKRG